MEEGGGKEEKVEGSGNDNCWLQREKKRRNKTRQEGKEEGTTGFMNPW